MTEEDNLKRCEKIYFLFITACHLYNVNGKMFFGFFTGQHFDAKISHTCIRLALEIGLKPIRSINRIMKTL